MTEREKKIAAFQAKMAERNRQTTPEPEPDPTPAPAAHRRGRPAKVDQKRQTRPHDAEVFRAAAAMLNMTATHDADKFGVTRQTLSKWMKGETSAPRTAYVLLLDELTRAIETGTVNVNAAAEARLNKAIDERIAEALKIMRRINEKGQ